MVAEEEEAAVGVPEGLCPCLPRGTIPHRHSAVPKAWGLLACLQGAAEFLHPM